MKSAENAQQKTSYHIPPAPFQNEEAEELMRKVEKEEEAAALINPGKQCFHLCIINLVIGTLYCAKVWRNVWNLGDRGTKSRLSHNEAHSSSCSLTAAPPSPVQLRVWHQPDRQELGAVQQEAGD